MLLIELYLFDRSSAVCFSVERWDAASLSYCDWKAIEWMIKLNKLLFLLIRRLRCLLGLQLKARFCIQRLTRSLFVDHFALIATNICKKFQQNGHFSFCLIAATGTFSNCNSKPKPDGRVLDKVYWCRRSFQWSYQEPASPLQNLIMMLSWALHVNCWIRIQSTYFLTLHRPYVMQNLLFFNWVAKLIFNLCRVYGLKLHKLCPVLRQW